MEEFIAHYVFDDPNYRADHGIKGQKWGIRRYQNEDGSLTQAGKNHLAKEYQKEINKADGRVSSNIRDALNNRNQRQLAYNSAVKSNEKARKAEAAGNTKKAAKYDKITNSIVTDIKIHDQKYEAILKDYEKNKKAYDDLYDTIRNDKNVTYYTREGQNYGDYSVDKQRTKQYGKTKKRFDNNHVDDVTGTRYTVKATNGKRENSGKFADSTRKDQKERHAVQYAAVQYVPVYY